MSDRKNVYDVAVTGYLAGLLNQAGNDTPANVIQYLTGLENLLTSNEFVRSVRTLDTLIRIRKGIEDGSSIEHERVAWKICQEIAKAANDVLDQYQQAKETYIVVNHSTVMEKLVALGRVAGSDREMMIQETVKCLESGACRAAIVMGWCLAYDHLRQWIFTNKRKRLVEFNAVLVTKNRTKNQMYDPITEYEQFDDLGERFVIDVAYEAELYIKQKNQVLLNGLTDRNHFAHPNSRGATLESAVGYIDNLLVNILTHPDFAFTIKGT